MDINKAYKSKIGPELVIPIITILGIVIFLISQEKPSWLGLIILLPVIVLIIHMFMTTFYMIKGEKLTIKCGLFFNKTLDIKSITKISDTRNLISSPALSIIERIEIGYDKQDWIIISPKEKHQFIEDMISVNPNIVLKLKNKS